MPVKTFVLLKDCESHKGMSNYRHMIFPTIILSELGNKFFRLVFPVICVLAISVVSINAGCTVCGSLTQIYTQRGSKLLPLAYSQWKTQSAVNAYRGDYSFTEPQERYLLQVITQLSVNTVAGDTMP